jgi:hypothetical protein
MLLQVFSAKPTLPIGVDSDVVAGIIHVKCHQLFKIERVWIKLCVFFLGIVYDHSTINVPSIAIVNNVCG